MAKKRLSKKEASQSFVEPIEATPQPNIEKQVVVPSVDLFPHQDALAELRAEVLTMTQGADPVNVVWQFELRNGSKGGTTVKYYQECKEHEIKTGNPCQYLRPVSAPVSIAMSGNMALRSAPKAMKAAKRCPNCK